MQKKKSGVKKCLEILPLRGGGGGPLMANAILNFHFDFLNPSLIFIAFRNDTSKTKICDHAFRPKYIPFRGGQGTTFVRRMGSVVYGSEQNCVFCAEGSHHYLH